MRQRVQQPFFATIADAQLRTAFAAWACVWQTVTINRLLLTNAAGLLLLGWGPAFPATPNQPAPPAIGRLQTLSKSCEYRLEGGHQGPCALVELVRKGPELLFVRFTGSGPDKGSNRQLSFVAITSAEAMPLHCESGVCKLLAQPWQGAVSSAAESSSDRLGLAEGIPRAWPVSGRCSIEESILRCQAQLPEGGWLRASAAL